MEQGPPASHHCSGQIVLLMRWISSFSAPWPLAIRFTLSHALAFLVGAGTMDQPDFGGCVQLLLSQQAIGVTRSVTWYTFVTSFAFPSWFFSCGAAAMASSAVVVNTIVSRRADMNGSLRTGDSTR